MSNITEPSVSCHTLSSNEIYQELENLDLLGHALEGLKTPIKHSAHRHYDGESILFHEGTPIDTLYIIRHGRIKLVHYMDNGSARIVRLHNEGSILGLNGLLHEAHEHTAISIDDVETFEIPITKLHGLKNDDLETYSGLLEYWNEYLHTADTWITEFSTGPIRNRVARLILYLIDNDELTDTNQARLLTGEEMSEILGVTPESVSRTIAEFKRNDLLIPVESADEHTYHCDVEKLESEAEG